MNVDVKSALDKLLLVCDHIQTTAPNGSAAKKIRNLVIADIFGFIDAISVANATDRKESHLPNYIWMAMFVPNHPVRCLFSAK